jgi:hypothetical protein
MKNTTHRSGAILWKTSWSLLAELTAKYSTFLLLWFKWEFHIALKLIRISTALWGKFRVLYLILWSKINHSPNYKQWKMYLWYGFKVFPVSLSFKCSVSKNASQHSSRKSLILVWLKVAIPKISCDNLSGEEMYSIHWICLVYVRRSWDMYPCASLTC